MFKSVPLHSFLSFCEYHSWTNSALCGFQNHGRVVGDGEAFLWLRTSICFFITSRHIPKRASNTPKLPLPSMNFKKEPVLGVKYSTISSSAVSRWLLTPQRPGLGLGLYHMGFVVDKVALRRVFSEYFVFLSQYLHRILPTHHSPSGS
jgi:hypothetical protein